MDNFTMHNHTALEVVDHPLEGEFIEANTSGMSLSEIRSKHVIPVFLKDNEPTISQVEFVEVMGEAAREVFNIPSLAPKIKVSHPIKGRTYEARHKKASELLEGEKTIYYERLAFTMEVPGHAAEVGGNELQLTVGGIKAYNLDNLNNTKGAAEHFKMFVGYKNMVCTNLCISTDGAKLDMKVNSLEDLYRTCCTVFSSYMNDVHLEAMNELTNHSLSESQFAQVLGKARLYQFLPKDEKVKVPELLINDTQISRVAEYYYADDHFQRDGNGSVDLWKFYNLLTGAIKTSYIDKLLEREVNSFEFTNQVKGALMTESEEFWYLK